MKYHLLRQPIVKRQLIKRFLFVLCFSLLSGCANYASRIRGPRSHFENGEYDRSIEEIKQLVARNDKDLLLYLMDLGMVYHTAHRYQEAIQTWTKADKLAEIKDYTSLSQETAAFIFSDEMKTYKGEYFEKLLINVYMAMDYTLMGDWENALVECRHVNHKIDLMINQGKMAYDHNAFAKYLSASLFEAQHEYNDAWVDYRAVAKWGSDFPYLGTSLLRMSDKLKASEEFSEYKKKYGATSYRLGPGEGEVVLLLEQGKAPYKIPNPTYRLIPMFIRNNYYSDYVWLHDKSGKHRVRTYPLYDIEQVAIKELDDAAAGVIAKKIGGTIAKGAIGYGVAKLTKSPLLGELAFWGLNAADEADLRSWTTLPARLQIARLVLPAGRQEVVLDMVSHATDQRGIKIWPNVDVKAGTQVFLNYRTPD